MDLFLMKSSDCNINRLMTVEIAIQKTKTQAFDAALGLDNRSFLFLQWVYLFTHNRNYCKPKQNTHKNKKNKGEKNETRMQKCFFENLFFFCQIFFYV